MSKTVVTRPFVTSPSDYIKVLLVFWLRRYGWMLAIPVIVCFIIGYFRDVRFSLIGVMFLFIIIPMLSSFLYPYYMLAPEARRAVLRKKVEVDEGHELRLIYLHPEKKDEKDDDCRYLPSPEFIPWEDIESVKYTSRFRIYLLKAKRLSFILIPHSAVL